MSQELRNRIFIWILVASGTLAFSFFLFKEREKGLEVYKGPVVVRIGEQEFVAEIADSPEERAEGLSGRDGLSEGRGMLFLFSELSAQTFWMNKMKFPIDIIWIRDGRVVGFEEDVSPPLPGTLLAELSLYTSPAPVDMVFEVSAGTAARLGITTGDKFLLK